MEPQNQLENQTPISPAPQMVTSQSAMTSAKKCKHIPVIIVLAIIAVAGIGLGGYELYANMQKDGEIANLQSKNDQNEQKIEEMTKEIEESEAAAAAEKEAEETEENQNNNAVSGDQDNFEIAAQDDVDIIITGSGKVCVADMTQDRIVTCADDLTEQGAMGFGACDSGISESANVLVCSVSYGDPEYSAKFIYNRNDNTFTHGNFVER